MRFSDLEEGKNDPGIFKAIFLAGGPGSGKSYVFNKSGLASMGLRVVNSDDAFEYLMKRDKLDMTMPDDQADQRNAARDRAKTITRTKQGNFLDGRLGIVIDGTAKDPAKIAKQKAALEALGYDTAMLFVDTNLRTAMERNLRRDRSVPQKIVVDSHKLVQSNILPLRNLFGQNFIKVSNDGPDSVDFTDLYRKLNKFVNAPLSRQAQQWIATESINNYMGVTTESNSTEIAIRKTKYKPEWPFIVSDDDIDEGKDTLKLPDIDVGDEVKVGKFKNRKATVTGFDKDENNQPVLKTNKGDQKLFKPRLSKLMPDEVDEGNKAQLGIPKDATVAQLKKIRSSKSASKETKQRAHWLLNMRKGK